MSSASRCCLVDTRGADRRFRSIEISNLHREHLPAISLAAGRAHYITVKLLLSYNASYNPPRDTKNLASGQLDIVDLLLNHGAEPNGIGRWHYEEKEIGDLPCIYFAETYPEIFRLLLDRGTDLLLPAAKARKELNWDLLTDETTTIQHVSDDAGRPVTAPTSTFVTKKALESGSTETDQILWKEAYHCNSLAKLAIGVACPCL
ncbi:hypothetical protein N7517_007959 [Penicillium concentricum]|uniref:Uncharacterized protein n=1 Tax=Penicillium concentricum TaxID=293559 RepID=A0A9W9RRH1_9EURO|nr:uncharacterized protein N7517_007959 [Penicillium concentricum]KAJ5365073.1 hypothetical protein N7517_007959 [Penicillium concentricum]